MRPMENPDIAKLADPPLLAVATSHHRCPADAAWQSRSGIDDKDRQIRLVPFMHSRATLFKTGATPRAIPPSTAANSPYVGRS